MTLRKLRIATESFPPEDIVEEPELSACCSTTPGCHSMDLDHVRIPRAGVDFLEKGDIVAGPVASSELVSGVTVLDIAGYLLHLRGGRLDVYAREYIPCV